MPYDPETYRRGRHASSGGGLMPHHLFADESATHAGTASLPSVVDVEVSQSVSQRARGVFTLRVHLQRPHGVEVVTMDDLPDDRHLPPAPLDADHRPRHARPSDAPAPPRSPEARAAGVLSASERFRRG
jgi:hypothetical protein